MSAFVRGGGTPNPPLLPPLDRRYTSGASERGTTVVVLVDAFGWNAVRAFARRARSSTSRRLAEGLLSHTLPITTVFPSTTSSALLSLSQGVAPGTHGIVGYTEYFPQWGAILNTLKWNAPWGGSRDLAIPRGFQPHDLMPHASLFSRGVRGSALTKEEFQGSAFTRMLYDGAKFEGYVSLSDMTHHLVRILSGPRSDRPSLLWVYWDLLDSVGHVNGPLEDLLASEVMHVLLALSEAASRLSPQDREDVHLFLSGDHGQVEVRPQVARAAHDDPRLLELLDRPPSMERRAAILRAREGNREELRAHLEDTLPSDWAVLAVSEVVEGGLFGPSPRHPELEARLGDFLVLPGPGATLWYRPPGGRGPEDHFLKGAHGGLSPEELLVGLVSVPFEELARWEG